MSTDGPSREEDENTLSTARLDIWKEALGAALWELFGSVFGFIYFWLVIFFLPQSSVGEFFFFLAFAYLFVQVPIGIALSIRKRVSERDSGRSAYGIGGLTMILLYVISVSSLFIFGLGIFGQFSPIKISFTEQLSVLFMVLTVSMSMAGENYLAGCGYPRLAVKIRTFVAKGSMAILTAISLALVPMVETAMVARGLAFIISFSVFLYFAPEIQLSLPDTTIFKELWEFCKWSIPTNILNDFYYRWDTILLGFMVGAVAISYYDSTVRIVIFGTTLAIGLSSAAQVKISGMNEEGEDVLQLSKDIVGVSSLITFLVLLLAIFNAEYLLTKLFGPEYAAAKWFFILMGITQLFHGFRSQFEAIFNGVDYPKGTTWISFLAVIINIITAPLLVLKFGGIGVVISTLLAECIRFILYQKSLYSLLDGTVISRLLTSQLIGISLAITTIWIVKHLFNLTQLKLLAATVIIGPLIFYTTIYTLSTQFRTIISAYTTNKT